MMALPETPPALMSGCWTHLEQPVSQAVKCEMFVNWRIPNIHILNIISTIWLFDMF